MIKKLLLLSVILSQLAISCSSDETPEEQPTDPEKELTLEEQIANIVKQPYSNLTPDQQKTKLEVEANDMLVQLDKSKSSSAIEALENLTRLLSISSVDVFSGKNDNQVEDILNVSGVYGIYTWNNPEQIWVKTASTTELKFVFPAKKSQTANNAIFTSKGTSSDVKVKLEDTYGSWKYNEVTDNYDYVEAVNDFFFLPTSTDAVLTIDGAQSATFAQTAKFSNGKQTPDEAGYKMTLSDGYTWEMSAKKGTENTSKASLVYNNKNLIEFNAGSTTQIDALLDNDEVASYRGKANGLIKLMDNFIIVADMDLTADANDEATLEKSLVYPTAPSYADSKSDFKAYYTARNTYNEKYSAGSAANFNKNMKLVLVSKKDGTKIADIVLHSEKGYSYSQVLPYWDQNAQFWYFDGNGEKITQQIYNEVYYLRFNDKTEVEMSVYFSKGFETLETKFEDFIKAFQK